MGHGDCEKNGCTHKNVITRKVTIGSFTTRICIDCAGRVISYLTEDNLVITAPHSPGKTGGAGEPSTGKKEAMK